MGLVDSECALDALIKGQSKFQGNIIDILMAPLSDYELAIGYIMGSVARGIICGTKKEYDLANAKRSGLSHGKLCVM